MIPLKDNQPTTGVPGLTLALIGLCLVVFVWQVTLSGADGTGSGEGQDGSGRISERDEFALTYGTAPERVADGGSQVGWSHEPPGLLSPLTAFFVSADLLHLAINLLFLWIFGRTLELRSGKWQLAGLLLLGVMAGAGAQAVADPESPLLVLGASTGLAGVLGAYAVLHHRARVLSFVAIPLFGTLIEVPALLLIGSWFAIGLIPALEPMADGELITGTGMEFLGYAAAFASGAIAAVLLARGREEPVTA